MEADEEKDEPTPADMTLRDWFAAHALAALANRNISVHFLVERIAGHAYEIADRMMAEREKRSR